MVGYLSPNSFLNYKDDSKYLSRIEEYVAKGKNEKAIETIEYLLSRQPFNSDYYKKAIELYEKTGKKEEAAYHSALMEILLEKN